MTRCDWSKRINTRTSEKQMASKVWFTEYGLIEDGSTSSMFIVCSAINTRRWTHSTEMCGTDDMNDLIFLFYEGIMNPRILSTLVCKLPAYEVCWRVYKNALLSEEKGDCVNKKMQRSYSTRCIWLASMDWGLYFKAACMKRAKKDTRERKITSIGLAMCRDRCRRNWNTKYEEMFWQFIGTGQIWWIITCTLSSKRN